MELYTFTFTFECAWFLKSPSQISNGKYLERFWAHAQLFVARLWVYQLTAAARRHRQEKQAFAKIFSTPATNWLRQPDVRSFEVVRIAMPMNCPFLPGQCVKVAVAPALPLILSFLADCTRLRTETYICCESDSCIVVTFCQHEVVNILMVFQIDWILRRMSDWWWFVSGDLLKRSSDEKGFDLRFLKQRRDWEETQSSSYSKFLTATLPAGSGMFIFVFVSNSKKSSSEIHAWGNDYVFLELWRRKYESAIVTPSTDILQNTIM